MTKKLLTGAQLEEKGLLKFTCDKCRTIFPARCPAHRTLVESSKPKMPRPRTSPAKAFPILAYGRPLLEYTAPYEVLELDIRSTLRAAH